MNTVVKIDDVLAMMGAGATLQEMCDWLLACKAEVGEKPVEHGDDIIIWPDGTYCDRRELADYGRMGDDYEVLWTDTGTWIAFVNRDPGPRKEEPTRFSLDMDGSMVPDEDGEWVRYES